MDGSTACGIWVASKLRLNYTFAAVTVTGILCLGDTIQQINYIFSSSVSCPNIYLLKYVFIMNYFLLCFLYIPDFGGNYVFRQIILFVNFILGY